MFKNIQNIVYDMNLDGRVRPVKNIFKYSYIIQSYVNNPLSTFDYIVSDSDSAELIAARYYGDPELSWVILLLNDIKDIYSEWPKSEYSLMNYLKRNYNPERLSYFDLKRVKALTKKNNIPDPKDGDVIYLEDLDQTHKFDGPSQNWNFISNGKPQSRIYNKEYFITLNQYDTPQSFVVSSKTSKIPVTNMTLRIYRGSTVNINFTGQDVSRLYITRDDGGSFTSESYFREYREGIENNRLSNGLLTFNVPMDAPNRLYYQSSKYRDVRGFIDILNREDEYYVEHSDKNSLQQRSGNRVGQLARVGSDFYIWNGNVKTTNNFISAWEKLTTDSKVLHLDIAKKIPKHYIHTEYNHTISSESYTHLSDQEKKLYKKYSSYEYEFDLNENNRRIKIMRREVLSEFLKEWERISK